MMAPIRGRDVKKPGVFKMPELKLVTFDLDDTLWDIKPIMMTAGEKVKGWLAERLPDVEQWYRDETLTPIRNDYLARRPMLQHDLGELRRLVMEEAIIAQGVDVAVARQLSFDALDVFLEARHQVFYFEDALETLAFLSRHFILGALTNGNTDVRRLGLNKFFSFAHTSAEVGVGKPHAEIFERALASAGVQANEALHVGDHLQYDIAGAAAVGMYTLHFNRLSRFDSADDNTRPDLSANTMRDLQEKILAFSQQRE